MGGVFELEPVRSRATASQQRRRCTSPFFVFVATVSVSKQTTSGGVFVRPAGGSQCGGIYSLYICSISKSVMVGVEAFVIATQYWLPWASWLAWKTALAMFTSGPFSS